MEAIDHAELGRCLFEESNDAFLIFDPEGNQVLDANPGAQRLTGLRRKQLLGMTVLELFLADNDGGVEKLVGSYHHTGVFHSREGYYLRQQAGEPLAVNVSVSRIHTATKSLGLVVVRDISERKRSELALRQSEERYRSLIESSHEGIVITGDDFRVTYCNPQAGIIVGISPEQAIGEDFRSFLDENSRELVVQRYLCRRRGEDVPASYEVGIIRTDGEHRQLQIHAARLTATDGTVQTFAQILDITDRKRAEQERARLRARIQDAQKLESLGVLAGGIAHDLNNLLQPILGHAEFLYDKVLSDVSALQDVESIRTAAIRAAELANQMLAYSGRSRFINRPIDLSKLAHETTQLLKGSVSEQIALHCDFAESLPPIEADPSRLRQVILNLITNASEAIGKQEGVISVSTGVFWAERAYLSKTYLDEQLPEGEYAYLEVRDTGGGMDADTLTRIFDPFFTTKFTGRGLGLAAVLGIVRGHRGAIRVDSEQGVGSTFRILLPLAQVAPQESATPPAAAERSSLSGTILVVDDEEAVRTVAKRGLERAGFCALTACDGAQAIEIFKEHSEKILAILLDMTMPRMTGREAFRELRRIRPDARVILSSGYTEEEATAQLSDEGLAGFIQKPYTPTALVEKLREVILQ